MGGGASHPAVKGVGHGTGLPVSAATAASRYTVNVQAPSPNVLPSNSMRWAACDHTNPILDSSGVLLAGHDDKNQTLVMARSQLPDGSVRIGSRACSPQGYLSGHVSVAYNGMELQMDDCEVLLQQPNQVLVPYTVGTPPPPGIVICGQLNGPLYAGNVTLSLGGRIAVIPGTVTPQGILVAVMGRQVSISQGDIRVLCLMPSNPFSYAPPSTTAQYWQQYQQSMAIQQQMQMQQMQMQQMQMQQQQGGMMMMAPQQGMMMAPQQGMMMQQQQGMMMQQQPGMMMMAPQQGMMMASQQGMPNQQQHHHQQHHPHKQQQQQQQYHPQQQQQHRAQPGMASMAPPAAAGALAGAAIASSSTVEAGLVSAGNQMGAWGTEGYSAVQGALPGMEAGLATGAAEVGSWGAQGFSAVQGAIPGMEAGAMDMAAWGGAEMTQFASEAGHMDWGGFAQSFGGEASSFVEQAAGFMESGFGDAGSFAEDLGSSIGDMFE